jgi:hypothetical protein
MWPTTSALPSCGTSIFDARPLVGTEQLQKIPEDLRVSEQAIFILVAPRALNEEGIDEHFPTKRLSVRREESTAYADKAATVFVEREGNSAVMAGEMSQMVAERPNAGAVRHYDRCSAFCQLSG